MPLLEISDLKALFRLGVVRRALPACALVLVCCLPALPAQAETTLQRIARSGTVVIGYRDSSIPFSYLDEGKQPVGYAIDLCRRLVGALGKQLGREPKIEYRAVTSANRIDLVAGGQVDLECGSTTNNAERRARVAFTVPHFITSTRFMVKQDSEIARHSDLHRAIVVTTRGSTAEKLFHELQLRSKLEIAPDHAAAFAMLEAGAADAFMMDDVLLASMRARAKDPAGYRILDESYRVEALSIAFARDDAPFKALVDNEMTRLITTGETASLYRKWFEQPIPPKGINLHWPMGNLLRNTFRFPSDWAPD
jgi:glutamate/aspartate transport system substrate-binding protein